MIPSLSKLHPVSIGVVAANKKRKSRHIEVVPFEEYAMLDGEVTDHESEYKGKGKTPDGGSFDVTLITTPSIRALWLPFGDTNRKTAPDVRRGEKVYIYQFGDADEYFWTTLTQHETIRRLECVIYAWSNNSEENVENDSESTYFLEISTMDKKVRFHTADNDGEFCKYDFQFDTKAGNVTLEDDIGNYFFLDSAATQLKLRNADDSYVDIDKEIITIHSRDKVIVNTQHVQINADQSIAVKTKKYTEKTTTYEMDASASHKTTTTEMTKTVKGNFKVDVTSEYSIKAKDYRLNTTTFNHNNTGLWNTITKEAKFSKDVTAAGKIEGSTIKGTTYVGGHHGS